MKYEVFEMGSVRFVRKPVEIVPPEGVICFVEDHSTGRRSKCDAARFVAGEWIGHKGKPLAWMPTHWTIMEAGDGKKD